MTISLTVVAAWTTWLRTAGRPDTTIGLRTYHVARIMREIETDPWSLTTQQLVDYLGAQDWAPETRRSYRASLRVFYDWAQATGRRTDNPARLLPTVKVPRGQPRPTPEAVYRQALVDADTRTHVMLRLGAHGLRRGEIAAVRRDHVETDLVGYTLRVKGKGGHVRMVPLLDEVARVLLAAPEGWIFPSPVRAGAHLTPHHVGKLVSAVLPDGWTCHTLRHRCATLAYWATGDLRGVQELLGHAKQDTTSVYTLPMPGAARRGIEAAAA